eukprot:scaffold56145_cov18-Tisochrysis_lutea.AAC.1
MLAYKLEMRRTSRRFFLHLHGRQGVVLNVSLPRVPGSPMQRSELLPANRGKPAGKRTLSSLAYAPQIAIPGSFGHGTPCIPTAG